GEGFSPSVVVEGKGNVAQLGEPPCPALLVVVEPAALMRDQDRSALVLAFGQCEPSDHRRAVGRVFDVPGDHHRFGSSRRRLLGGRQVTESMPTAKGCFAGILCSSDGGASWGHRRS